MLAHQPVKLLFTWRTRFYSAVLDRDLFGQWSVTRSWGSSRNSQGGGRVTVVPDFDGGLARSTLRAADGRSVSLWQDEHCRYVHVFVTGKFPGRTTAVALEPMTGPANAFNSGDGLGWLPAGESFTMSWGITASLGS